MATRETIEMRVDMRNLAGPGTYDGYIQTEVYPEALGMWGDFLWTHPQYVEMRSGEHTVKYAIPAVTFEQALASSDEVLRKGAEVIYARARRQAAIAHRSVSAYEAWRQANSDMIVSDFGSIVLGKVSTSSPVSAEPYADAA